MMSLHILCLLSTTQKMLFTHMTQCRMKFIFILFTLINFSHTLPSTKIYRPSNIEITPNRVIIESNSTTNFLCINHRFDDPQLEASLSKPIPSDQIKISTNLFNATTMRIKLESHNYVGTFYLLCYVKGQQSNGIYSDVIVKAAPGVLQLNEKCQVYERQYIKCRIQAPTIAAAVKNGFPPRFEFNEITHSSDHLAYISRVEFLEDESTNDLLVFKWRPTVEGEFPNGIRMHMKQLLDHFEPSSYYFDMTPVFRIIPKYILKVLSSNQIQIDLTSISPSAYCEKSYALATNSVVNRTWTVIEPERKSILLDKLVSNSIYKICIKCQQAYGDPDGLEQCQDIKTFPSSILPLVITVTFTVISLIILIVGAFWMKRRRSKPKPGDSGFETPFLKVDPNIYHRHSTSDSSYNVSVQVDDSPSTPTLSRQQSVDDNAYGYLPISSISMFQEACSPKILTRYDD